MQTKKMHIEDLVDTVSRPESGQDHAESSAGPSAAAGSGAGAGDMEVEETPRAPAQKRSAESQDPDDIDALEEIESVLKEINNLTI